MEDLLYEQYGSLTPLILTGLNTKRKASFRVNTTVSDLHEVTAYLNEQKIAFEKVSWYDQAFVIDQKDEYFLKKSPLYEEGKIYFQSLSSMIPPLLMKSEKKRLQVLDMCAAPGSKTCQLVNLLSHDAKITAVEKNKIRGERLKYNLKKQRATRVKPLIMDALNLDVQRPFDMILLDAPCTMTRYDEKLFTRLIVLQRQLLDHALKLLKPDGLLVYSTCSLFKNENEMVLNDVLPQHGAFVRKDEEPFWNDIAQLPSILENCHTIMPNEYFEGFFIAKIGKKER